VQIRGTCDKPNDPDPACPAQANLNATSASALYHTSDRASQIGLICIHPGACINVHVQYISSHF